MARHHQNAARHCTASRKNITTTARVLFFSVLDFSSYHTPSITTTTLLHILNPHKNNLNSLKMGFTDLLADSGLAGKLPHRTTPHLLRPAPPRLRMGFLLPLDLGNSKLTELDSPQQLARDPLLHRRVCPTPFPFPFFRSLRSDCECCQRLPNGGPATFTPPYDPV